MIRVLSFSMFLIGDHLREKYDEATQVKMNKRGRLQVKDSRYKVPTALDLVYLDESPDWCRQNKQLQWPGRHLKLCSKPLYKRRGNTFLEKTIEETKICISKPPPGVLFVAFNSNIQA